MAGQNRYLRGKQNTIRGDVKGNVTIEAGDLVAFNNQNGTCGINATTALTQRDETFYSLQDFKTVTAGSQWMNDLGDQFAGVAMTGSASGVTNEIVVATTGVFRYPLYGAPGAVTIGAVVAAVTRAASTAGTSRQSVVNHNTQSTTGTTAYLGRIVKTESGASYVDFELWSGLYNARLT